MSKAELEHLHNRVKSFKGYKLSQHAESRLWEKGISKQQLAHTVLTGRIVEANTLNGGIKIVLHSKEENLLVVVSITTGQIVTAFWDRNNFKPVMANYSWKVDLTSV